MNSFIISSELAMLFNKKWLLGGLLLLSCGCQAMNNTEAGALGGGVFGTALGTAVGAVTGRPLLGAALGAAAGTTTGALVGASEDRREVRQAQAAAAYTAQNALSLSDIARMAQDHISDSIIIQQIRSTGSVYNLTPDQITWLKQMGVSDTVVMEMQSRRAAYVRPGRAVYVVEPPPPPIGYSVGIGYGGWGR